MHVREGCPILWQPANALHRAHNFGSGKRFVPRILDAVQRMQLPVISARSTYEARYPGSPCDWKTAACESEAACAGPKRFSPSRTTVIWRLASSIS